MANPSDGGVDFVGPDLKLVDAPNTGGVSVTGGTPVAGHPSEPQKHPTEATHSGLIFPLFQKPLASYKTGGRFFGAPRTGRLHAAVDLLNPYLAPIRAIADGVVIQPVYSFYQGTNALEVHHPGVGTVRYGEITSRRDKQIVWKAGDKVEKGQTIAHVGILDGNSASMLHFELYTGKGTGELTVFSKQPYERRWDLENPTSFIDHLLAETFP